MTIPGLSVTRVAVVAIMVALITVILFVATTSAAPTVTTDKAEYHPDETAIISGTGYTSGQLLDIVVIRPDSSIVTGSGTNTFGSDTVTATSGAFSYDYILNGIFGLYTVNVYDNVTDPGHTTVLATTTFLDDAGPAECNGGPTDTSQPGDKYTIVAPSGEVVTGICIKSGTDTFDTGSCDPPTCTTSHSGLITADGTYGDLGCFTVSDLLTGTAMIERGTAPPCKDISHIDFFTAVLPSKIIICKETTPDGSPQSFTFTPSYGANFILTDGQCDDSGPLTPGMYSVSETVPAGWTLDSIVCDDANSSGTPPTATINLEAGETVTCTFNNSEDPLPGTIIICKETTPNASLQSFAFSSSYGPNFNLTDGQCDDSGPLAAGSYSATETVPAGWTLDSIVCDDGNSSGTPPTATINLEAGETVTCTFNNSEDPGTIIICKETTPNASLQSFAFTTSYGPNFNLTDGQCNNSGSLAAGSYSATETVPAGWTLDSIVCDDGNSSGTPPTATINLEAGETVTCTFNNTLIPPPPSTLKIVKDVTPDDPTTNWVIDVVGPTPFSDILSGDDITAVTAVEPGTYTITETAGLNTDLNNYVSSFSCIDALFNPVVPLSVGTVITVAIAAGEDVICTFFNTDPRLKIIKDVVPDDSTTNWNFEVSGPTSFSETIAGDGMTDEAIIDPGTYTITETAGANTSLGDYVSTVSCTGASPNPPPGSTEITFTIDLGEFVICTFTNSSGTPPPGPNPVGGIAGLLDPPDDGLSSEARSGGNAALLIALMAGAAVAIAGASVWVSRIARRS